VHPSEVITHITTQAASIIHHPHAVIGKEDNVTMCIIRVGRKPNVTMLMVIFTVFTGVISLTITALMSFLLTENVTSTHQRLMTVAHANYLMVSYILVHAITTQTVPRPCFRPATASATKIRRH